jgi:carbonic anhydrase
VVRAPVKRTRFINRSFKNKNNKKMATSLATSLPGGVARTASPAIQKLKDGFKIFKKEIFEQNREKYAELAKSQAPKIMVVGCADSRVDPAVLFGAEPGELFQVRSVANLVPPYERGGNYHGTSAALEFAVTALGVEQIIILGHQKCGGIRALVERRLVRNQTEPANDFIDSWVSIADPAVELTRLRTKGMSLDQQCEDCEQSSIDQSLKNLMTFPWIQERVNAGKLDLHGWWYNMASGTVKMWQLEIKHANEEVMDG